MVNRFFSLISAIGLSAVLVGCVSKPEAEGFYQSKSLQEMTRLGRQATPDQFKKKYDEASYHSRNKGIPSSQNHDRHF
jgi:hypothetical protein